MFDLKVIKKFNGKEEGKILSPGETVKTNDLQRVNALVGRGYCVITAFEAPKAEDKKDSDKDPKGSKEK